MLIYYTQIENRLPESIFEYFLNLMPSFIKTKTRRFRRWEDAHLSLFGNLLLLKSLKERGFKDQILEDLNYTPYNRPFIREKIDFNISHSGKYVICVSDDRSKVGIDIEHIVPINIDDFKLQFTNSEFESINSTNNPYDQFYKVWTQKESVIKADGRGLNINLKDIKIIGNQAFIENNSWYLKELSVATGYTTHLASDKPFQDDFIINKVSITENAELDFGVKG